MLPSRRQPPAEALSPPLWGCQEREKLQEKSKKRRKVYAVRRHNRGVCTQKQPELKDFCAIVSGASHRKQAYQLWLFAALPLDTA